MTVAGNEQMEANIRELRDLAFEVLKVKEEGEPFTEELASKLLNPRITSEKIDKFTSAYDDKLLRWGQEKATEIMAAKS